MSTLKFNTWLNTDNTENYKCRAWVNFNGTGTVAIRASGNVSSITDNGTGVYQVNLTTAMPDANYAAVGTAKDNGSSRMWAQIGGGGSPYGVKATTYFQFYVGDTGALYDSPEVNFAVFR